jgi:hypothetical protein
MLGAGKGQTGAEGSFPGVEVGGALRHNIGKCLVHGMQRR